MIFIFLFLFKRFFVFIWITFSFLLFVVFLSTVFVLYYSFFIFCFPFDWVFGGRFLPFYMICFCISSFLCGLSHKLIEAQFLLNCCSFPITSADELIILPRARIIDIRKWCETTYSSAPLTATSVPESFLSWAIHHSPLTIYSPPFIIFWLKLDFFFHPLLTNFRYIFFCLLYFLLFII